MHLGPTESSVPSLNPTSSTAKTLLPDAVTCWGSGKDVAGDTIHLSKARPGQDPALPGVLSLAGGTARSHKGECVPSCVLLPGRGWRIQTRELGSARLALFSGLQEMESCSQCYCPLLQTQGLAAAAPSPPPQPGGRITEVTCAYPGPHT